MSETHTGYYLPHHAHWPILGSIGLTCLLGGFALFLNGVDAAHYIMIVGGVCIIAMMFGWFGEVIKESQQGAYNDQVDVSFRWGMFWFIFSEVMFFGAFFGALFYTRIYSIPWLGGEGYGHLTKELLWPSYSSAWPSNGPAAVGGQYTPMEAWGIPAINTLILLTSGATITWAHWGLKENKRKVLALGLFVTVALGISFLILQAYEYTHAYEKLNLTLHTGIYGSTFFMLTGFHGLHVTIGAIMLTVMLVRVLRGHFTPKHHFAFEAASWYWHFVDVVWLLLFIFVYWM
ncbi:MAG: cytochrome c oxidase subunit 3 [Gammaproteobacteria bacterium]